MIRGGLGPFLLVLGLWACGGDDGGAEDTSAPDAVETMSADVTDVSGEVAGLADAPETDTGDMADAPDDEGGDDETTTDLDGGDPGPQDASPPVDDSVEPVDADGPDLDVAPPIDGGCVPGEACELEKPPTCYEGICNPVGHCVASKIPDCCLDDSDCTSLPLNTACGVYRCVFTYCVVELTPGCCDTDADCDDETYCTVDSCESPGSMCTHCPTNCLCSPPGPVYQKELSELETTLVSQGLLVLDNKASDYITWRASERRWVSPPTALWVGHESCPTYYNGSLTEDCQPAPGGDSKPVDVSLVTSDFNLSESPGGHVALMWTWSQVEDWKTGGADEPDVLQVSFQVGEGGVVWPLTSTKTVGKNTFGEWKTLGADLSPWNGKTGRLHLQFRTVDDQDNHHEGVYIDSLQVVPRCAGGCCETDADCTALLQVDDPCDEARCVPLDQGAGSVCAVLPGTPGQACTPCGLDATCADDNPCTQDLCTEQGVCSNEVFCCFENLVVDQGFEDGLVGWYLIDHQIFDTVFFHPTITDAVEGTHAATIWPGTEPTYDTGDEVTVGLLTSSVILPEAADPGASLGVSFWLKLSTEWDGQIYDNPAGLDRFSVAVVGTSGNVEIWSSDEVEGSTNGLWVPVVASLDAWAGESVQIRFDFSSIDGEANDFAGPVLDAIEVGQICPTD